MPNSSEHSKTPKPPKTASNSESHQARLIGQSKYGCEKRIISNSWRDYLLTLVMNNRTRARKNGHEVDDETKANATLE